MPPQLDLDRLSQSFSAVARHQGWSSLHSPKSLACALSVEAGELLRLFQWQNDKATHIAAQAPAPAAVAAELADIVLYANALADQLDIDLCEALEQKCAVNERRFGPANDE